MFSQSLKERGENPQAAFFFASSLYTLSKRNQNFQLQKVKIFFLFLKKAGPRQTGLLEMLVMKISCIVNYPSASLEQNAGFVLGLVLVFNALSNTPFIKSMAMDDPSYSVSFSTSVLESLLPSLPRSVQKGNDGPTAS